METLTRQARLEASRAVPDEWRQSLPIPVREANGLRIAFFFCPARLSPTEGQHLAPPDHLAYVDVGSGRIDLLAAEPIDFDSRDGADVPLGAVALPAGWTAETYLERRRELLRLLGPLSAEFARAPVCPSDQTRADARVFRPLFAQLHEAPLTRYYLAVGGEFFGWIDALAQ